MNKIIFIISKVFFLTLIHIQNSIKIKIKKIILFFTTVKILWKISLHTMCVHYSSGSYIVYTLTRIIAPHYIYWRQAYLVNTFEKGRKEFRSTFVFLLPYFADENVACYQSERIQQNWFLITILFRDENLCVFHNWMTFVEIELDKTILSSHKWRGVVSHRENPC